MNTLSRRLIRKRVRRGAAALVAPALRRVWVIAALGMLAGCVAYDAPPPPSGAYYYTPGPYYYAPAYGGVYFHERFH